MFKLNGNMTESEIFTKEVSNYMNTFVNAISKNKDAVLAKLEDFPGEHHILIKKAIEEGPETLPQDDAEVCKSMFNFIVFFATGKTMPSLEVTVKRDEDASNQ